ncbi:MAG: MmgE/PrpD family protein [Betaproteobacteria bacterium]|nr:MmgE/PrpD family protein [Betaproteobacteria bacterium]
MNERSKGGAEQAMDSIQQRLTDYACALRYESLTPQAIHAAKSCVIDTLGALVCGFFGEPCRIARDLAARMPQADGVTVIGTRMKSTPDMAAFVNATTARYAELTDIYHLPGSAVAHPSDALTPVLAAAEHAHVGGRDFITAIVLAYEVGLQIAHVFRNDGFDNTNLGCLASAVGAGKVLGLSATQLAHCISMAIVPNNVLKQARRGRKSMFKAVAAGQAGRAGVFAALLARDGMEGPHLPFEGTAGWCKHVGGGRFTLGAMGGGAVPYKILDTRIKNRPAAGPAIACILAAEKLAPIDVGAVRKITVEVHQLAKNNTAPGERPWPLTSREDADHSTPFLVAATLRDGTVMLRSFDDAHLNDPDLRNLMQKVEVVVNAEFTHAYEHLPQQHRARLTVVTEDGRQLVAEAGGDADDLAAPRADAQIERKFREMTEDHLGKPRASAILERLWTLEAMRDVAEIAPCFALA